MTVPFYDEAWGEEHMDGWTVALRLMSQDNRAVIGELRIFPTQIGTDQMPGRWDDEESIPAGGLGSRELRSVKLGNLLPLAQTKLRALAEEIPPEQLDAAKRYSDPLLIRSSLIDAGFFVPELAGSRHPAQSHPGAGGHNVDHYLWYARTYVVKVRWGSTRPNHEISEDLFGTPEYARYVSRQVRKARKLCFLTDPLVDGKAGGSLTQKARDEIERIGDLKPSSFVEEEPRT